MPDLITKKQILQTLSLVQGKWKNNNNNKKPEDKEITTDGWNVILFEKTKNGKAFRNWIHDLQNKIKLKTVRLVKHF